MLVDMIVILSPPAQANWPGWSHTPNTVLRAELKRMHGMHALTHDFSSVGIGVGEGAALSGTVASAALDVWVWLV